MMGLFDKKTVDRNFDGYTLTKTVGIYKIYTPTVSRPDVLSKFAKIFFNEKNTVETNDKGEKEIAISTSISRDVYELLTNINYDLYVKNERNLDLDSSTVNSTVVKVLYRIYDYLMAKNEEIEAYKEMGLIGDDEVEITKENRNDKEVILAKIKSNEKKRHEEEKVTEVVKEVVETVVEKSLDDMTLEELQEIERQETIARIKRLRSEK